MKTAAWVKYTSKEQKIAVKLAGRIKNFAGKSPAIIKVKINESMIIINFKWTVSDNEKKLLTNQSSHDIDLMQKKLFDITRDNLLKVLPIVLENKFEICRYDCDIFQENLVVQIQLVEF